MKATRHFAPIRTNNGQTNDNPAAGTAGIFVNSHNNEAVMFEKVHSVMTM